MMRVRIRLETYYDPGDPNRPGEDGFIETLPCFGVLDAYGPLVTEEHPARIFNPWGLTGGQRTRNIIQSAVANWAASKRNLRDVLNQTNRALASSREQEEPYGAAFAIGRINQDLEKIELDQGADCVIIVVFKGRKFECLWDEEFLEIETWRKRMLNNLGKEAFRPKLMESQLTKSNVDYAVLDGNPKLKDLLNPIAFPLNAIEEIIFLSDGVVPWNEMPPWEEWAERIIHEMEDPNGFKRLLHWRDSFDTQSTDKVPEASLLIAHFDPM